MNTFTWQPRPEDETRRLTRLLQSHLRRAGVTPAERTSAKCRELLLRTLAGQNGTCYFAGGDDRYCWNHPKDKKIAFLKLEWGHLVPTAQSVVGVAPKMILLCARCNNQLQTSRTLEQLIPELEHKLPVIKSRLAAQPDV
jgi:hypothetical protein